MVKEQWYQTNPMLFEAEKKAMKIHYPDANLSYLKDGRAYWEVTLNVKVNEEIKTYIVMILYGSNHSRANSCIACPIKPTMEEIVRKAKKLGKNRVPHIWYNYTDGVKCFDTSESARAKYIENEVCSAILCASATLKWLYFYEWGLIDEKIWDKFTGCG